jgi:hypothetical protein
MRSLIPLALAALASTSLAQTPLTTMFASNNGGATGGAVFFDLNVQNDVTLAALDVNVLNGPGIHAAVDIYIANGTYSFHEQDSAFWGPPVSHGEFVTQDLDVPSFVPLETPVHLPIGTHAVAVVAHGFAHAYTNGNGTAQPGSGTNQSFGTAEMTLQGGSAMNTPFSSTPFQPRMANVSLYYGLGRSGLAGISATYGASCYDRPTTVYEQFPAGGFDLAGGAGGVQSLALQPNGAGGYRLQPGSNQWFDGLGGVPGAMPASTPLMVGDDSITQVSLPQGFGFTHPGSSEVVHHLYICSNGFVSPASETDNDFSPSAPELVAGAPRWCPAWKDLEPNAQGTMHFDVDPAGNAVYVTWHNVPEWGFAGSSSNSFQAAFFSNGVVEYRWERMDSLSDCIVGYSSGRGATDPGGIDLSVESTNGWSSGTGAIAPTLDTLGRPLLGQAVGLVTDEIPNGTIVGFNILSFIQHTSGIDLAQFGAPGCHQHVGADLALLFLVTGKQNTMQILLPGNPAFLNAELFAQSAVFASGQNLLGLLFTNGVRLRIGDL